MKREWRAVKASGKSELERGRAWQASMDREAAKASRQQEPEQKPADAAGNPSGIRRPLQREDEFGADALGADDVDGFTMILNNLFYNGQA